MSGPFQTEDKIAVMLSKLDIIAGKICAIRESSRATHADQFIIGTALAILIVVLAFMAPTAFESPTP